MQSKRRLIGLIAFRVRTMLKPILYLLASGFCVVAAGCVGGWPFAPLISAAYGQTLDPPIISYRPAGNHCHCSGAGVAARRCSHCRQANLPVAAATLVARR